MSSRVSLSILAFVVGAALMLVALSFFSIAIQTQHTLVTLLALVVAAVCVVAGWVRIFRRRPQARQADPATEAR